MRSSYIFGGWMIGTQSNEESIEILDLKNNVITIRLQKIPLIRVHSQNFIILKKHITSLGDNDKL